MHDLGGDGDAADGDGLGDGLGGAGSVDDEVAGAGVEIEHVCFDRGGGADLDGDEVFGVVLCGGHGDGA